MKDKTKQVKYNHGMDANEKTFSNFNLADYA